MARGQERVCGEAGKLVDRGWTHSFLTKFHPPKLRFSFFLSDFLYHLCHMVVRVTYWQGNITLFCLCNSNAAPPSLATITPFLFTYSTCGTCGWNGTGKAYVCPLTAIRGSLVLSRRNLIAISGRNLSLRRIRRKTSGIHCIPTQVCGHFRRGFEYRRGSLAGPGRGTNGGKKRGTALRKHGFGGSPGYIKEISDELKSPDSNHFSNYFFPNSSSANLGIKPCRLPTFPSH